jgi:S-layer protein
MTVAEAAAATLTGVFAGKVAGLEVLSVGATAGPATINMLNADGISSLVETGVVGHQVDITGALSGFTLTQNAINTAATTISLVNPTANTDTVNLVLAAANGQNAGALTLNSIEILNVTTNDTSTTTAGAATAAFQSTLTATSLVTVMVVGDAGYNAGTIASTALTTFDASGVTRTGTGGAVTLTTADLGQAATLTGGAGTNTITAAAVQTAVSGTVPAVTITGGAGLDALTGGNGADTISGGNGGTTGVGLVGNAGNDTITGGTGTDTITGGLGADTLTGGAGVDTFVFTDPGAATDSNRSNLDTIIDLAVGTGGDSITLINTGTEVGVTGGVLTATAINTGVASTLTEALDLASTIDGSTNAQVNWVQFGGNTYLVQDRSASTSFDDSSDLVIKISGTVDLLAGTNLAITFA